MADSRGLVHVRHVIIAAAACLAVTIIIIIIRPQRQQLAKFVCQKEGHHEVVPASVGRGQGGPSRGSACMCGAGARRETGGGARAGAEPVCA